jgi:DNA-binding NtrC family response regulator
MNKSILIVDDDAALCRLLADGLGKRDSGAVGGNKTSAAQILGFDRRTMYRKLERFDQDK